MDHQKMLEDFKKRFKISLVITVPILVLSPMIQSFFGYTLEFAGSKYLLFLLSTIIFFYGGWPFLSGLKNELADKNPGMMTLIALAISVAYFYSSAVVFGLEGRFFFWELATLIVIMLLGHWIEMRSVMGASNALEELAKLMPDEAHKIVDGEVKEIKIKELKKGDQVLVKPGEKVPADGVIYEGDSYIDESMLTGESEPVERGKDEEVIGGSVNGDSSIKIKIEKAGEDSYLSQVIEMVKESQAAKSKTQNFADRAAFWLTIIAITAGTVTFGSWFYITGDLAFAIERMATVMVITCPHALGLAIPLVVAVSTTLSAKNGLLIRNRTAFENARKIDTVLFDKTGTLTEGEFGVETVETFVDDYNEQDILQKAASLEQESEHPIAAGIVKRAEEDEVELIKVDDFEIIKGKGVIGKIDGRDFKAVSPGYLKEMEIEIPDSALKEGPFTEIFILEAGNLIGMIRLGDQIRESSYEAVQKLKDRGIKVTMLTGDNQKTAEYVSNELGLTDYFAEVLPDEKQKKVEELQAAGDFVAMTGDGVNDAPALAKADIGIAIGSGTDVAAETADIILVESDPLDVLKLIEFGSLTFKKMIQNLFWATGYNAFAIPLAAGVLAGVGIMISPAVGAVLMSMSTVIVAINAKMLKF
ncbi:MAG: Cu2+-exporting ATPase [Halanaerobium sp. 4-GBenrich]|jgi:Cu2+-exporting ATPase|uniref:P-type Cu(+) transporter n=1 Tax=Halanaerobium congolense TaxID=54121 RepID=A0A1G6RWQ8_9FIRM|nr:copper-translocating P-type ATPase [Halanaerobium congolense]KXS50111.1 MAG: Cu2+-exporting ATPase [Halanaerobium sp. T82-1]ODS49922.1 MAG: Cu2+-exporting ATPase [Halanaerobium sp. 4-GBenrich]OEG62923.1 MAG: copper-translocating P-type ATPase [Halanaerobium sp. MDAL1]PUU92651.1 MAG: Cu2+-exporting ATPase [Halanaerobium sp.]PTX17868.1 Cu2+-exporting ATPase [Halanaerobium congolense]